jgi:hypothetical protein
MFSMVENVDDVLPCAQGEIGATWAGDSTLF